MNELLSRKFLFVIIFGILGFVLVLLQKTTADGWFEFIKYLGTLYIAGNVGADAVKQFSPPKQNS